MRGVFLYVFGDVLGLVIVVVNVLVFYFFWKRCFEGEFCVNSCIFDFCKVFVEIINGIYVIVYEVGFCWVLYLDLIFCIVMVCIFFYIIYLLFKEFVFIFL